MIWIVVAIIGISMAIAEGLWRRRRVDRLAELAGIRRFPGESSSELERRIGDRFRIVEGGRRK